MRPTKVKHEHGLNCSVPVDPTCPTVAAYVKEIDRYPWERRKALWRVFEWDHKKSCPRCMEHGCANVRVL